MPLKRTLNDSLTDFRLIEKLDTYVCDLCLKNSCTKKVTQIKFNKYLLIRMNRFNKFGDKLSDKAKFESSFEIEGK
jgi:ubiquitin C-terminal hydrolase